MRTASVMPVHRRESRCAREVAELKHGAIILFGSGSQMKVHVTPASDKSATVEQHSRSECKCYRSITRKCLCAGEAAELKNGDIVLFGSDSQMKVHITPASDASTTVEQHLHSECEMLMQRVQVSQSASRQTLVVGQLAETTAAVVGAWRHSTILLVLLG